MVIIVGAGCFGLSTAYHLLKRGHTNVTVLDRSPILPAPEAASTDINKIVRSSYADIFYSKFARDALGQWKDRDAWADCYHESGVVVLLTGKGSYGDLALANDRALGARTILLPASSDNPSSTVPPTLPPPLKNLLENRSGYINQDGGWVHSSRAVELMMDKVRRLGGNIIAGKAVQSLLKDASGLTNGVKCADGSEYKSDIVVLAAGAWTPSTFTELNVEDKCVATAQIVAKIQLTPEEAERHRADPVYLDLDSGFYMFPPNEQNIIKCAVHGAGFTHRSATSPVSTPTFPAIPFQTSQGNHRAGQFETTVPRPALQELRGHLSRTYPDLADKPWVGTRMCWYTDSADEDWIIGFHPLDRGVMFATAGSGHAMKFLPNIGSLVADALEGKMDAELVRRFAFDRAKNETTLSRPGKEVQELELGDLVGPSCA